MVFSSNGIVYDTADLTCFETGDSEMPVIYLEPATSRTFVQRQNPWKADVEEIDSGEILKLAARFDIPALKTAGMRKQAKEMGTLEAVIITGRLREREATKVAAEEEQRAMRELFGAMVDSPSLILQKLVDRALAVTGAETAGISVLEVENGVKFFRWHATAGKWRDLKGTTLPREYSPCGTVLDRNVALLMSHPERYYSNMAGVTPAISEVLLVPFYRGEVAIGTVWVIAHNDAKQFTEEDVRQVRELSKLASIAVQALASTGQGAGEIASRFTLEVEREQEERLCAALGICLEPQRHAIRVLVVEDHRDTSMMMARLLGLSGYEVLVANTAAAALKLGATEEIDIMVSDIGLPDGDGYELMKEMSERFGVKGIALSGYGMRDDVQKGEAAGFSEYIIKPVGIEKVDEAIQRIVGRVAAV
jgi:CheY-like chemotaxis protein